MAIIKTIDKAILLSNIEKITLPATVTDPETQITSVVDYNPGKPFKILINPKSSMGISKGTLLSIAGMVHEKKSERVVTVIAGEWSPAIFRTSKGSEYTYGNATELGVIYLNDGKSYLCDETVKAYDDSALYAVGEYSTNSNKVYKCTTAVETAENFDSDKWSEVSDISDMVSEGIFIDLSETDIYVAGIIGL